MLALKDLNVISFEKKVKPLCSGHLLIEDTFPGPDGVRYGEVSLHLAYRLLNPLIVGSTDQESFQQLQFFSKNCGHITCCVVCYSYEGETNMTRKKCPKAIFDFTFDMTRLKPIGEREKE